MNEANAAESWLELTGREPVAIRGTSSLGRAQTSDLVLRDDKVSRLHAIVREQDAHEFWIHDMGGANGTYVNGRRVTQPTRLKDGDRVGIAHFQIFFRQRSAAGKVETGGDIEQTIVDFKTMSAWLLVADIQGSTLLAQQITPEAMKTATGAWIHQCRSAIEASGGTIEKLLGDGFMAVWPKGLCQPEQLVRALKDLKQLQTTSKLPFRLVLHFGEVFTGSPTASGAEKLFGPAVNFSFRMESVARTLTTHCLLSEAAFLQLKPLVTAELAGSHSLSGFHGQFNFFTL